MLPTLDNNVEFILGRWLPGIAIAWGTVMTLMGLVKTYVTPFIPAVPRVLLYY